MKKAVITIGISASGKSTHAREWVEAKWGSRMEINRDMFRKQLMEADGRSFSWAKWNWKREKEVDALVNQAILTAAALKQDIICSDLNLSEGRRTALVAKLEGLGYEVEIKEFPITLEEAWKRDTAREHGVGQSVIAEQYQKWLAYKGRKVYVANKSKPTCILVDVDGTLAHMNGKRGAFDWGKVGVDDCDDAVRTIVNMSFANSNATNNWNPDKHITVIILSGRDGVCEPETVQWLKENRVMYHKLIMRAPNDMRKDTIVKEEIFWRDIADNYNVQFVIDDRPSVARMWRELGLKVFQVGNPHVEF
jgi:predicted kinase